jgi:cyclic beta-1,2-glucan synthetase
MSQAHAALPAAADLAHPSAPSHGADEPIRAELYGPERTEALARRLAGEAAVSLAVPARPLLAELARNGRELDRAHAFMAEACRRKEACGPDADWLLDNFHIVIDALHEVSLDLPGGYYRLLPRLASGPLAGYPRVYAAALALIAHSDSSLDEGLITRFVQAYQEVSPLAIGELWAVPIMLRLALLENLRRLAGQILQVHAARRLAREWAGRAFDQPAGPSGGPVPLPAAPGEPRSPAGDAFAAEVLELLREQGPTAAATLERLEQALAAQGDSPAEVLARERKRQAANQVSIGNCVTSLRLLSSIDWMVFFERTSLVEALLREDPAGVYPRQDFPTRDRCRRALEQVARRSGHDELDVARRALETARSHYGLPAAEVEPPSPFPRRTGPPRGHVGYYLFGEGIAELRAALGYRPTAGERLRDFVLRRPRLVYFGSLALATVIGPCVLLTPALAAGAAPGLLVVLGLVALLPASELAVGLVNRFIIRLVPPRVLPKLHFESGIPTDCSAFIVMPTMLVRPDSARVLLERLEIHYLSNPERGLYFALLTDFADAPAEHMPEDDAYLEAAIQGVRALNERYCAGGEDRFFVFHRRRQWNPVQGVWMGWERKRGKLAEFNRLLRGDRTTSFAWQSGEADRVPVVRYVITLDADTQMPHETARRLIATLAHPLNQALFDAGVGRVVAGYGILQPRISLSLPGSRKTLFARLFSGSAGIDPYTTAVSDVYQDLFGCGSFTGKGIYDVDAFEVATGHTFPDNRILSHDLIEGNYARCGLVTDIELLDEFPPRYHAYARREHRWARGDWQILAWLFPRVPAPGGVRRNPLPLVERWKVFDNLRRSLLAPAMVLLALLGWFVLPGGAWVWTAAVAIVVAWPALLETAVAAFRMAVAGLGRRRWQGPPGSLVPTAGQALLAVVFLAEQARLMLDAVIRTLYRLYVSHRRLLEWETAAATEHRLGQSLPAFCLHMWFGPVLAVAVTVALGLVRAEALPGAAVFLLAWYLAPLVAWFVSRPLPSGEPVLTPEQRRRLRHIARKTWCFFETFVRDAEHWLPPDNYQEDPKGELAHRTSPTNVGLHLLSSLAGHDLGFISLPHLLDRVEKSLGVLDRLERCHGHFFNWYDTRTLRPLTPRYISTVDSGNLAACLVALRQGLAEKAAEPVPSATARQGLADTLALAKEAFRHTRVSSALPPADAEAQEKHLQALAGLVAEAPADLPAFDAWLGRLEGHAAELAAGVQALFEKEPQGARELRRWVWHLLHEVRDHHAELHALAPWLAPLGQPPAALAGNPPGELGRRWEVVRRVLSTPASPAALARQVESLARDVIELEKLLLEGPGPSEAAAWLGRMAGAVRASAAAEWQRRCGELGAHAVELSAAMDFRLLYNRSRHLFAIGFEITHGRLDPAHYDLLASEACLTSFLAVARGDVPRKHWFQLSRPLTSIHGVPTLLSWGGTMFEYLMPRLLFRPYPDTILEQSRREAVVRQIEYGRQRHVPWGISESAFNSLDAALNYQYQAFGVPGLGLKRGLARDLVIAPYATALALAVRPRVALQNFERLAREGGEGPFGFYEAIDYTPERVPPGRRGQPVRCFMAHHQGMALVALANRLLGDVFPRRFHAEPMVRATELLLQERLTPGTPTVEPPADEETTSGAEAGASHTSRRLTTAQTTHPRTDLISNGTYSVVVTNSGAGRSTCRGLDVTRWREDATRDCWGQFLYVRDRLTGRVWSATFQPLEVPPDEYEVLFAMDKAEFTRLDGLVETRLEVTVSQERCAEVRRLSLTNLDTRPHELEVTSYVEPVLQPHGADLAHPAFGKLFLETEWLAADEALLCRRRPRSADQKPLWCVHVLACEGGAVGAAEFETDRARFLGRGRTPADPAAMGPDTTLTGTTGAVLDPVLSIRRRVRVDPGATVGLAFTTAVAESREEALALADHHHDYHGVGRVFELAWAHAQVELRHLHLSAGDVHLYQRLASHVLQAGPSLRASPGVIATNRQGTPGLWRQGISGDRPIVLVRVAVAEELPLVRQILAAHAYWRHKGLDADLVILNAQPASYRDELQEEILALLRASDDRGLLDKPGGVFVRRAALLGDDDQLLLEAAARCVLVGVRGSLAVQLDRLERAAPPPRPLLRRRRGEPRPRPPEPAPARLPAGLLFANGRGGFTSDGREYVVLASNRGGPDLPPAPWINVVANPACGFLISEAGSGYTWVGNSQQNRLTPWSNDPVSDPPGEAVYLRDEATGEFWTSTPLPAGGAGDFLVRHGQGYTTFEHSSHGLQQELTLFAPRADPVKIYLLRLRNTGPRTRRLSATFYAEWVLGTVRDQAAQNVVTEGDTGAGPLLARNPFNADFGDRVAFADASGRPRTFTADRREFLGRNGSPADPQAMSRPDLSGTVGGPFDPCAALRVRFELGGGEQRVVVFCLGQAGSVEEARRLAARYRDSGAAEAVLRGIKEFWDRLLTTVQVRTPDPALDLLVNRWLLYQVLSCRIWGRSAFYQSGGAYGFRDQLQDVMALVYAFPKETRAQLLRSAGRQFPEGDVQHWWHPPSGAGIRTRCSDDFLWLPFVAGYYVATTGDRSVLEERVPFLEAPLLQPNQEEDYRRPVVSAETATVYEHCARAIEHGFRFGANGLPLMGTGDWNDGMNKVGAGGKGESVWDGWFQLTILRPWAELAQARGDAERAARFRDEADRLRQALEEHAWDGAWYRRAWFDDGTPLGSAADEECKIDSLAQTWAVMSGAADPERARAATAAVDEHLVRRRDRLILLLTPPFDKSSHDPGYIKGYLPGIRENGGQYTHAATWVVEAFALMGEGTKALELYDLLNPIRHAASPAGVARYRVEPYVVAGDVYGAPPHTGRGGWSWYSGSAGWMYRVALETLLGFHLADDRLSVAPCIPRDWTGFTIEFRRGATAFEVTVENAGGVEHGVTAVELDGRAVEGGTVVLPDAGGRHTIRVVMG